MQDFFKYSGTAIARLCCTLFQSIHMYKQILHTSSHKILGIALQEVYFAK